MNSLNQSSMGGRTTLRRVIHEHAGDQRRLKIRCENGMRVRIQNGRLVLGGAFAQSARPKSFAITGVTNSTRKVTLRSGEIIHGPRRVTVTQPSGGVLVAGGTESAPTYAALRYTYATGVAVILAATVVGFPLPTKDTWEMPLFSAYLLNGRVRIKEVLWEGMVLLPGVFAP